MNTSQFFDYYYNNAEVNSIMVLDTDGIVLDVNNSFTNNFGYKNDDIKGRNFNILFNEPDQQQNKPVIELETVMTKGQAHDENYVVDKKGHEIWCTGESLLVYGEEGKKYIVKDIVNLQAKKQLQLFLTVTEELLERIFESSTDIPMLILDGTMKVQKANAAFLDLFEITRNPVAGSRLSEFDHPFWHSSDIKKELSNIIVMNEPLKRREFLFYTKSGEMKVVSVDSKIIDKQSPAGRIIFIIMEDITPKNSNNNQKFKHSL